MTDIGPLRARIEALGGLARAVASSPALATVVAHMWRRGTAWQLVCDPGQCAWITRLSAHNSSVVWRHGRQRGKSFAALALLDTYAREVRGSRMRYCALTIETARAILSAAMEDFYATCPAEYRPVRVTGTDDYKWPGGATLCVMGTDAQTFRRGRGLSRVGLQVLDECGFYQDMSAVERALGPGLQVPGPSGLPGRTLYCSTPAESPSHPYSTVARVHRAAGRYECETFYENPRVDAEAVIRGECARTGMVRDELLASTAFRREYLGEDVVEETRAAVPAWTASAEEQCVVTLAKPPFFDGYVGLDLGYMPDPSAALLGWHDVAGNRLVVTHEVECHAQTVAQFADALKVAEREAWGADRWDGRLLALADEVEELPEFLRRIVHKGAPRQPFLRVGDNNPLVLAELAGTHGYAVMPTRKDEKALAVDDLNQLIRTRRILIDPRCKRLVEQLRGTVWNKTRTEWERGPRDHGDLIDSLVYMARNVRWHRDCRPKDARFDWPTVKDVSNTWGSVLRGVR